MMAESGSYKGSNHQRGVSIGQGWEEARQEFYQEDFLRTLSSDGAPSTDTRWETMLPSKMANTIDTRTWGRATHSRTVRNRRRTSATAADIEMETMPDLAQGFVDEEETWNQLQQIRSLPVNMAIKRELKAKLMHTPTLRVYGLAALQFQRRKLWYRLQGPARQFLSLLSPWKSSIRKIEANCGTGVASYFLLIRWLFLLNLAIAAIVSVFIIIPWEVGKETCPNLNSGSISCEQPLLLGCSRDLKMSCPVPDSELDKYPEFKTEECFQSYRNTVDTTVRSHGQDPLLLVQDTIQGTGWLELTLAFYGYYQPAYLSWADNQVYDMGLSYELTIFGVLLLSLICISKSVAAGFRDNISLGKSWLHRYSDLAFASWDHCIDKASVANHKKKTILNSVRAALADDLYAQEKASRTTRTKFRLLARRVAVNFGVVVTLLTCAYIIYLVTRFSQKYITDNDISKQPVDVTNPEYVKTLFIEFLPSMVITLLNFFVPKLFGAFVTCERYSAPFEMKISLARTVFLRTASLIVLTVTLYFSLSDSRSIKGQPTLNDGDDDDDKINNVCDKDSASVNITGTACWETYIGQQLYRLSIFDALITVSIMLLVELPLALILRRWSKAGHRLVRTLAYPQFDLASNTLDLVYSQSICWLGVFYSPILAILTTVKCILIYYVKYLGFKVYYSPPSRLYGGSSSTSLFINVLLLSFIASVVPLGYHISTLEPSLSCGPYRGFDTVWSCVSQQIDLLPWLLKELLSFFGTATFYVPAIVFLFVATYYYRAVASARRDLIQSLKQQLILEGQDKQFLLSRLVVKMKQQQQQQQQQA